MNDIGSSDPMVQLAELMLNAEEVRAKADDDALRSARQAQKQALENEVRALHEAADHTRAGAWLQGGVAALSGLAGASAYAFTPGNGVPTGDWGAVLKSGGALEQVAVPLGRLLGEAPSQDAQADAKQAEAEAADAGTRADMAYRHHERVRDEQDRTIATVESIVESEAQGNWALIANV
jgi:hypothetical protein